MLNKWPKASLRSTTSPHSVYKIKSTSASTDTVAVLKSILDIVLVSFWLLTLIVMYGSKSSVKASTFSCVLMVARAHASAGCLSAKNNQIQNIIFSTIACFRPNGHTWNTMCRKNIHAQTFKCWGHGNIFTKLIPGISAREVLWK